MSGSETSLGMASFPRSEPRTLPSGRPERYELDDRDVSSPPQQYTLLKAFDASHIFNKNPRKYDRLIAQEEGYSVDDSSWSQMSSSKTDMSKQPPHRQRSNSLGSLDEPDIHKVLSTSVAPELDYAHGPATSSTRADHMYRRCSLDHMSDYYTRRSSDAAVSAIWESSSHPQWQTTVKQIDTSAVPVYKPEGKKDEIFGKHQLTDIMMKAAFQDPMISPRKDRAKTQIEALDDPVRKVSQISDSAEEPHPSARARLRRMSLPETARDVQRSPIGNEVTTKMSTVQPEPRRLFGIGPKYHPLPEVVVEEVERKDSPLLNLVKKEGLGAGMEESVKKPTSKRTAPTKAEMNAWAPFSM